MHCFSLKVGSSRRRMRVKAEKLVYQMKHMAFGTFSVLLEFPTIKIPDKKSFITLAKAQIHVLLIGKKSFHTNTQVRQLIAWIVDEWVSV